MGCSTRSEIAPQWSGRRKGVNKIANEIANERPIELGKEEGDVNYSRRDNGLLYELQEAVNGGIELQEAANGGMKPRTK